MSFRSVENILIQLCEGKLTTLFTQMLGAGAAAGILYGSLTIAITSTLSKNVAKWQTLLVGAVMFPVRVRVW